ncbi:MAG: ArgE/DapE family deacylase [Verrucomicrobiae bacterium]|nr:ArgE/DapE family deacylase [Verrucomicrobiae bacterium]
MEKLINRGVEANRAEVIGFLKKFLSLDSQVINQGVKGREGKAQRFIGAMFRKLGAEVDFFEPDNRRLRKYSDFNPGHDYAGRPNMVAVLKGTGRSIILNGHVDTVSPGNLALWKHGPWDARITQGRIFSLGSCDMKGGLAAMAMAVMILKKLRIPLKGSIIFQSVVDEEGGGNGSLACVDRGYRADAALIAEPTDFMICAAHRGAMHLKITTRGVSTHASLKSKGVNAIEKMVKVMDALGDLEKAWHKKKKHALLPSPSITFCQLTGGVGASIIPAECEAKVNVKYLPTEKAAAVRREVEDKVREVVRSDEWLGKHPPQLTWLLNSPPYETAVSHPLVGVVKKAVNCFAGEAKVGGLPSGADARILNNVGKIPTFIMGPGHLYQAHQPNEYLMIDDYIKTIKVYALALEEWLN